MLSRVVCGHRAATALLAPRYYSGSNAGERRINKVYASAAEAVADIPSSCTMYVLAYALCVCV
jgi:hypothetical protein